MKNSDYDFGFKTALEIAFLGILRRIIAFVAVGFTEAVTGRQV